jgi:phage N-6-adenine-methyltransferase
MMQLQLNLNIDFINSDKTPKAKDCWETPLHILALVQESFNKGAIVTDPCTTKDNPTCAIVYYTPKENGLSLTNEWQDNAFVNPPYSNPAPWLKEIDYRMKFEQIQEAIALVPTGCISTKRCREWVQTAAAICHWEGRIAFIHPVTGKEVKNTNFVSSFLYWGKDSSHFLDIFFQYGIVAKIETRDPFKKEDFVIPNNLKLPT